jgi:hypothetical protein
VQRAKFPVAGPSVFDSAVNFSWHDPFAMDLPAQGPDRGRDGSVTQAPRGPTDRARYWTALPWFVLIIGIPGSVLVSAVVRDAVENVAQLRFDRQAADAKNIVENRIQFYADILYGLKALIAGQGTISRVQFHNYVKSLDLPRRYPGFDVVNFMQYVPAKDKQRFEESVRRDTSLEPGGYPNFAIKPPGERPEYFVLVYIEPMAGFEFSFGLDVGANPGVSDPKLDRLRRPAPDQESRPGVHGARVSAAGVSRRDAR